MCSLPPDRPNNRPPNCPLPIGTGGRQGTRGRPNRRDLHDILSRAIEISALGDDPGDTEEGATAPTYQAAEGTATASTTAANNGEEISRLRAATTRSTDAQSQLAENIEHASRAVVQRLAQGEETSNSELISSTTGNIPSITTTRQEGNIQSIVNNTVVINATSGAHYNAHINDVDLDARIVGTEVTFNIEINHNPETGRFHEIAKNVGRSTLRGPPQQ